MSGNVALHVPYIRASLHAVIVDFETIGFIPSVFRGQVSFGHALVGEIILWVCAN